MKVMDISQSSQHSTESQRRFLAKWILPVLFVFLGISSWMSVNLLWVEMPLLVTILPEQWNLASYVSVLIQFGNIGPLLCVFIKKKSQYAALIYLIISWLIATHFILSFVYDITTEIGSTSYSVAFFIEAFFMAMCDCTSNVTYLPYMASFNPRYLVFFFIGQGLAGLIPSILALIQGSGSYTCEWHNSTLNGSNTSSLQPVYQPPRFSFSVFLYVTTSLLVLSLCAYICIDFILKKLKKQAIEERQAPYVVPDAINGHVTAISDIIDLPQLDPFRNDNVTVSNSDVQGRNSEEITESTPVVAGRAVTQPTVYDALDTRPANSVFQDGEHQAKPKKLPFVRKQYEPKDFAFEYILAAVFCFFLNGFMPGFQTYSAVPYGQLSYTLCACLAVASVPCASWLTMLIKLVDWIQLENPI